MGVSSTRVPHARMTCTVRLTARHSKHSAVPFPVATLPDTQGRHLSTPSWPAMLYLPGSQSRHTRVSPTRAPYLPETPRKQQRERGNEISATFDSPMLRSEMSRRDSVPALHSEQIPTAFEPVPGVDLPGMQKSQEALFDDDWYLPTYERASEQQQTTRDASAIAQQRMVDAGVPL